MDKPSRVLWHQSGVNHKGEPFVQLFLDDEPISQFTPQEAREFALVFLESAEASEQDAFLREFFMLKVGSDEIRTGMIIHEFRKWREAHSKKGPPSDPAEFMATKHHKYPDGVPCKHPGCLSHVTHPCEGCGRIAGKYPDGTL